MLYCERNLIERFLTRLSTSTALRRDMISSRETILPRFCWSPQSSSTAKLRTESFLEEFRPCDLRTNPHHSAAGLPSIGVFVLVASRGGVSHCGHCQHNPSGHTDHEGEHDVHHFHSYTKTRRNRLIENRASLVRDECGKPLVSQMKRIDSLYKKARPPERH